MKPFAFIALSVVATLTASMSHALIDEKAGTAVEAHIERVFQEDVAQVCALPVVVPGQVATAPDGSLVIDRVITLVGVQQSTVQPGIKASDPITTC